MENDKAIVMKKIYGTDRTGDIFKMIKRDAAKIKGYTDIITMVKKYAPFVYFDNSIHTIANRFVELKKAVNSVDLAPKYKEKLIEALSAPIGFYEAYNDIREQKQIEKSEKKEVIDFDLNKFDEIIQYLYDMGMDETLSKYPYKLGSRQTPKQIRAYYLATYLALTTGRRLTEILKTMELRKYKDLLKVKGILKKRNDDENKSYNLLPLDDIERILTAYKELRRIFDTTNLTERQVNQKHNAKFNEFLRTKIFPNSNLSFHDLRKIYLLKAYELYGKNEQFETFAEKALVHDVKLNAKFITQTSHYTNATTTTTATTNDNDGNDDGN